MLTVGDSGDQLAPRRMIAEKKHTVPELTG
jgi:hypothetical protein